MMPRRKLLTGAVNMALETTTQDIRHALRGLRATPGFTTIAILLVTLAIGGVTTIYSAIGGLLLRMPRGVTTSDGLVWLTTSSRLNERPRGLSYFDYEQCRIQGATTLSGLAAYESAPFSLGDSTTPKRVQGQLVAGGYFSILGVHPALGRFFNEAELQLGADQAVVVIGEDLWRGHFGGGDVRGREVILNGIRFTIIGVAGSGFNGPELGAAADLWVPMGASGLIMPDFARSLARHDALSLRVLGRLLPSVSPSAAESSLAALGEQLARDFPDSHEDLTFHVTTLRGSAAPDTRGDAQSIAALLAVIASSLLAIASLNIGNLLLARALRRAPEVGVRLALGASRTRLLRQFLTESAVLGVGGGICGLVLSLLSLEALARAGGDLRGLNVLIDARTLGVAVAATLIAALLFGAAPALRASRLDVARIINERGRSAAHSARGMRLQAAFIVIQLALSLVLLVAAGQFVGVLRQASHAELGFRPDGITIVSYDLSLQNYSPERRLMFDQETLRRLAALPGVRSAALANVTPLSGIVVGDEIAQEATAGGARRFLLNGVSPGYFVTLGIHQLKGRPFDEGDRPGSPRVAILSETAARQLSPANEVLGRTFRFADEREVVQVIGVVADAKVDEASESPAAVAYLPLAQQRVLPRTTAFVSATGSVALSPQEIARVLQPLDPTLPFFDRTTLREVVRNRLDRQSAISELLSAFGLAGLAIAAIGLYGVIAYTVTQRRREIGIRLVLGAAPWQIARMVVGQGLRLAGIGFGLGSLLALPLAVLLASEVFGLRAGDLSGLVGAGFVVALATVAATFLPAQRAANSDPAELLRHE